VIPLSEAIAMQQFDMFIDGAPVQTGRVASVINPATGKAFAEVQVADMATVDRAVAAAKAAFPAWSRTSDEERRLACHTIMDLLEAHMPEFMELLTRETGKPMGGLGGIGSGMEVGGALAWGRYTAELQLPIDIVQDDDAVRIEVHRKPLGVVASVLPWNWPLMIAVWHIIPALRTGNTVVTKPSPFTPLAVLRFVELAGSVLPPGVLNVVTGEGDVGAALTSHVDVAKIVFTGSTATGKRIMQGASASLKRLTLELGGNDAGIVLPDADIEAILPKLFTACFHNNGQTCAALKRLYVHDSQYDQVCELMADMARKVVVGDGMDPATELGPIQNKAQFDIVRNLAQSARADGGRFLCGGAPIEREGFFFAPTIVADLTDGSRLVDEEPFGPIVPIIRYSDLDEVIERANRNERGLGGSVWSSNLAKATEVAQQLECGAVWVNNHAAIQPNAPFGGVKQSGIGVEFGLYGLEEYTSIQTVAVHKS